MPLLSRRIGCTENHGMHAQRQNSFRLSAMIPLYRDPSTAVGRFACRVKADPRSGRSSPRMTNSIGVHFSVMISSGHLRAPISWIKSTKIKSTNSAAIFFAPGPTDPSFLIISRNGTSTALILPFAMLSSRGLQLHPCPSGARTAERNHRTRRPAPAMASHQQRVLSSRPSRQLRDGAFLVAHCGQGGL